MEENRPNLEANALQKLGEKFKERDLTEDALVDLRTKYGPEDNLESSENEETADLEEQQAA